MSRRNAVSRHETLQRLSSPTQGNRLAACSKLSDGDRIAFVARRTENAGKSSVARVAPISGTRCDFPFGRIVLKGRKSRIWEVPVTVGEHLKKRRDELGPCRVGVAERLGVDPHSVTDWEKGSQKAGSSLLARYHRLPRLRPASRAADARRAIAGHTPNVGSIHRRGGSAAGGWTKGSLSCWERENCGAVWAACRGRQ